MFGYSLLQLYFLANMVYTVITFIFLHNILAEKMYKEYKQVTSKEMSSEQLTISMNIFYVISAFIGTFRFAKDILNFILNNRQCVWMYRVYKKDE